MSPLTTNDNWLFEVKVVRAIKTNEYGKPYSAIATITLVNGEAHVEGLLSKEHWGKADSLAIENYLKANGYQHYYFVRYKSGVAIKRKKRLK